MSDWDARIYKSDGTRFNLPAEWMTGATFEIIERGGYGNGSIEVGASWTDLGLTGTERADMYLFGELAYRGWIRLPQTDLMAPERYRLSLFGMITVLDKWIVKRRFAYSQDTDLSVIFTDLIQSVAMTAGRYPGLIIDSQTIGVTAVSFDAYGKSLAQALNQLCDLAPQMCIWGADVNGSNQDRVYFRPRNTSVTQKYAIGGKVTGFIYPQDTNAVINRVILKGGAAQYANLAFNGSFEYPEPNDWQYGNLIWEPSFEDVSILNEHWVFSATASTKQSNPGDTTAMGAAHSGSVWVELDTPGEYVYQIVPVDYTQPMMASMWARREGTAPGAIKLHVDGLNASGAIVASYDSGYQDPGGDAYVQYFLPVDFTAYPTVVKAQFWVEGNSGTANNDGNLVDDVALYEVNGCAQDGWIWDVAGAAAKGSLIMDYTADAAYHGGLSVLMEASGVANSSTDWLELKNTIDQAAGVHNQTYTLLLHWQSNGVAATFSFGVYELRTDDSITTTNESAIITQSASSWNMAKIQFIPKSDCVKAQIFIRNRSNAPLVIDGIMLAEGDLPVDVNNYGCYWEGTDFEAVADATDARLIHLNPAVANSIAVYGDRETAISNSDVTDWLTAELFISSYLNAHAYPEVQGKLNMVIDNSGDMCSNSGSVQLVNIPGEPQSLFPSRISYTVDMDIRMDVDLGNERPDMALLLRYLSSENSSQNTGTGGSSPSSSGGNGGGVVTTINGQSGSVYIPGLILDASTPSPVASAGSAGSASSASPGDHAHEGVHTVNGLTGDVTVSGLTNPMTAAGDVIIGGASGVPERLAIGSSGQVLTVTGGAPAWEAVPGSTGVTPTPTLISSLPYTITADNTKDYYFMTPNASGDITLPSVSHMRPIWIAKHYASQTIWVYPPSGTLDGLTYFNLGSTDSFTCFISDGVNWHAMTYVG